jgi:hypothetical protein
VVAAAQRRQRLVNGGDDLDLVELVLQPDGKLVAAGTTRGGFVQLDFALARYNPDGILDPTFGTGDGNDQIAADDLGFFGDPNAPGGNDTVVAGGGDDEVLAGPLRHLHRRSRNRHRLPLRADDRGLITELTADLVAPAGIVPLAGAVLTRDRPVTAVPYQLSRAHRHADL